MLVAYITFNMILSPLDIENHFYLLTIFVMHSSSLIFKSKVILAKSLGLGRSRPLSCTANTSPTMASPQPTFNLLFLFLPLLLKRQEIDHLPIMIHHNHSRQKDLKRLAQKGKWGSVRSYSILDMKNKKIHNQDTPW